MFNERIEFIMKSRTHAFQQNITYSRTTSQMMDVENVITPLTVEHITGSCPLLAANEYTSMRRHNSVDKILALHFARANSLLHNIVRYCK